ncbi:MAG: enoyl-CoA hydratase/isomerase family protein [Deltaproteobacteria bacterium]|nr:enoyl-CoA hydratase/isomerase family protein [Deltaproteobacteria bacterium]
MTSQYETILYQRNERVIYLTLNRPEKRNAMSEVMLSELSRALDEADQEDDACVIVLRGAGDKAFSAGADLGGMGKQDSFLKTHEARGRFSQVFLKLLRHSKVTIAAVNGHCLAGAVGLMLACDLAVGRKGFKIGTPEIKRGLFPFMISALILRRMGHRAASELMLLGETITTEEAAALGLLNRAVPDAEFEAIVYGWANKLAGYSPAVLRLGRRALVEQEGMPLEGAFSYLQGLISINAQLDDAEEGIRAFFERRDPMFTGR